VSFWIGTERGVAFVVTRSGLTSHQLPGRRTLDRDVARLRSAIAAGQMDVIRQTGAALHQSLFGKVNVAALAHVIVVPDGPLWRAPLAALATGTSGGWLAEKTAVSVVPSASLLSDLPVAGAGAREPALVFGLEQVPTAVRGLRGMYDQRLLPDRRLAFAATEAEAVARLTGTNTATALFVNARADESAFKQATKRRFRVMHVASHALIDDNAPRRSALVLAPGGADDGLLQLNEIANLQLDVDLVVLSTCQSQLGRTIRGEGLESLSRAFILAGGRAVVASIWAVDDRETSRLMPFFYTALRAKSSPAEALRNAQLQMIKSGGTAALPSSWAGFVIMGRGNVPVF
jgi:CHAT domain-containing protein